MRGAANPNWKGGRIRGGHKSRYMLVHSPGHPNASTTGYVLEHRLVMERKLGRLLGTDEIVHHLNGNTTDNRPENLTVMSQADHARHHYDEHLRPHRYVRPPAVVVVKCCVHCGEDFEARGKKEASRRFCTRACYLDYRRDRGGKLQRGVAA